RRQHYARQNASHGRADAGKGVRGAKRVAIGGWRSKQGTEPRKSEYPSRRACAQPEVRTNAPGKRKTYKRLAEGIVIYRHRGHSDAARTERRTENRCARQGANVWSGRRQNNRRRAAKQRRTEEHLRVRQIEPGKVQRTVNLNAAKRGSLEA